MALTRFGFIVTGSQLDARAQLSSPSFHMEVVGVATPELAIPVARRMVEDGVQLIELCGGFGPVWTARIIDAIEARVPIGSVSYGPESIAALHAIFSDAALE